MDWYPDVLIRVGLLFVLSFVTNGGAVAFVAMCVPSVLRRLPPHVASRLDVRTILLSSQRSFFYDIWSYLSWSQYLRLQLLYVLGVALPVGFALLSSDQLTLILRLLEPSAALSVSLALLCFDLPSFVAEARSWQFVIYAVLAMYGMYAGAMYSKRRGSGALFYLDLIYLFLFYIPLLVAFTGHLGTKLVAVGVTMNLMFLVFELLLLLTYVPRFLFAVFRTTVAMRDFIKNFGLYSFVQMHWQRLQVPALFDLFCVLRLIALSAVGFIDGGQFVASDLLLSNSASTGWDLLQWLRRSSGAADAGQHWSLLRYVLARSCETMTATGGFASALAAVAGFLAVAFRKLLNDHDQNGNHPSPLIGILFMFLSLQTGITSLSPDMRLPKIYRNLWLLSMAMLHFFQGVVDKVSLRLCATGVYRWKRHFVCYLASTVLVWVPVEFLRNVYFYDMYNPWMISVAIFAIELLERVVVTAVVYVVSLVDSLYFNSVSTADDLTFLCRSAGSVMEFFSGILLFVNGLWIFAFEHGGVLRAVMLCIHAYANLWLGAVNGWANLKRRRSVRNKLSMIADATAQHIAAFDGVCCICYSNMTIAESTKVLSCRHLLHSNCLRKWLCFQDKCPLCFAPVFAGEST